MWMELQDKEDVTNEVSQLKLNRGLFGKPLLFTASEASDCVALHGAPEIKVIAKGAVTRRHISDEFKLMT
jgi:hypothetical protein